MLRYQKLQHVYEHDLLSFTYVLSTHLLIITLVTHEEKKHNELSQRDSTSKKVLILSIYIHQLSTQPTARTERYLAHSDWMKKGIKEAGLSVF